MKYGLPKLAKTGEDVGFKTVAGAVYTKDGLSVQDHLDKLNNKNTESSSSIINLKIGILGDGILAGVGLEDPENTSFNGLLAKHFASCINYGVSGRMIAYMEDDYGHPTPYVTGYATMSDNLDLIVIHGTTNDWYYCTPIGNITDTDVTTYYGALNTLILGLQSKYPGKDIFFVTPLPRTDEINVDGEVVTRTSSDPNEIGKTLLDYNDVMITACKRHSMPVIDLYSNSGMNIAHNNQHKEYYTQNGNHLTEAGHHKEYKYLFNQIVSRL